MATPTTDTLTVDKRFYPYKYPFYVGNNRFFIGWIRREEAIEPEYINISDIPCTYYTLNNGTTYYGLKQGTGGFFEWDEANITVNSNTVTNNIVNTSYSDLFTRTSYDGSSTVERAG
jgi:hypothetical protein